MMVCEVPECASRRGPAVAVVGNTASPDRTPMCRACAVLYALAVHQANEAYGTQVRILSIDIEEVEAVLNGFNKAYRRATAPFRQPPAPPPPPPPYRRDYPVAPGQQVKPPPDHLMLALFFCVICAIVVIAVAIAATTS